MSGNSILAVLAIALALTLAYVFTPSDTGVERRFSRTVEQHRGEIEKALAESNDLLRDLAQRKSAQRKKMELSDLRKQALELQARAEYLLEDESVDTQEALRGLDELEPEYYALMRNCQDLAARLRIMQEYDARFREVIAKLGRNTRDLLKMAKQSTDPGFTLRVEHLIEESRKFRDLAEEGIRGCAFSIVKGKPIAEAGLNALDELIEQMHELAEKHKASPGE
jgi:uncharacterized protein YdiU (UPF0061 family)